MAERIAVTAWGIDEALGLENAVIMTKQVPLEEEEKPKEEEPLWQCAPAPPPRSHSFRRSASPVRGAIGSARTVG